MMSNKEVGFADLLKNGKSLKQHRDEMLARTKETGHYNGLTKLALRDSDPIAY
jgi:acetone carboxylase alpha subunit